MIFISCVIIIILFTFTSQEVINVLSFRNSLNNRLRPLQHPSRWFTEPFGLVKTVFVTHLFHGNTIMTASAAERHQQPPVGMPSKLLVLADTNVPGLKTQRGNLLPENLLSVLLRNIRTLWHEIKMVTSVPATDMELLVWTVMSTPRCLSVRCVLLCFQSGSTNTVLKTEIIIRLLAVKVQENIVVTISSTPLNSTEVLSYRAFWENLQCHERLITAYWGRDFLNCPNYLNPTDAVKGRDTKHTQKKGKVIRQHVRLP